MDDDTKTLLLHIVKKLDSIERDIIEIHNATKTSSPYIFKIGLDAFAGLPEHLRPTGRKD